MSNLYNADPYNYLILFRSFYKVRNQVSNVMVIERALRMIFLFVMPVLMGAFVQRGQFVFSETVTIYLVDNLFHCVI